MDDAKGSRALAEVAAVALKLGFTAFGGPAVHIAMLREEVVVRRRWLTDDEYLDLLGATNLIPGPNSTEMMIHVGYRRAGWRGLLAGGALFILPAALIVLAFAWAYVEYGRTPGAAWILYGVKPVIIAVVVQAIWGLARTAVKSADLGIVAAAALAAYLAGVHEIAVLFGAGLVVLLLRNARRFASGGRSAIVPPLAVLAIAPDLTRLTLVFLKIGAILYGSGYVLVAFLHSEFVERLGWLTDQQLLDAVAVGQFTPGPLFTTATFVGYLIGSWPGAVLATIAIFLPSFVFVAISNPFVPRLRRSPVMSALLDGVNAGSLGLMAGVTWQLGRSAILDPLTAILASISALVLLRWRLNSAWLVAGGALVAVVVKVMGG
ncbi:MAG TPA: chromate efflux transporter [Thermoanaerobaculia bacterium]|nr:chromate efflux transporter [Thermoanaerobaculia bacterium]